jgi:hypothetical protein
MLLKRYTSKGNRRKRPAGTKLAGTGRKQYEGVRRPTEHGSQHDKQGKLAVNHGTGFEKIDIGLSQRSSQ